jgi:hypothetical protein
LIILKSLIIHWEKKLEIQTFIKKVDMDLTDKIIVEKVFPKIHTVKKCFLAIFNFGYSVRFLNFDFLLDYCSLNQKKHF